MGEVGEVKDLTGAAPERFQVGTYGAAKFELQDTVAGKKLEVFDTLEAARNMADVLNVLDSFGALNREGRLDGEGAAHE